MRTKAPRHPGKRRIGAAFIALTLALSGILVVEDTAWAAHVAAVPMGTLTNFSVLSGTMITDTGGTSTFSDGVGVWPGTVTTGISPGDVGSGGLHQGDGVALQAQTDLSNAFDYVGDQTASPIAAELGGQTLPHGVYRPGETALTLTGTLTLDGGGDASSVFIIQTAGALGTAASSQVLLTNGAQECNVFWQVEGAVTLGANSVFRGNILAQGAVTVGAGVSFRGRAFTGPGAAMTLSDNTFFEPTCVGVTVVPSATPLVTTEVGGAATFTVVLNSQPTATVTIGVSSNNTAEGTVSTSLLTFTNLDWAAAQTVTVTGVNDSVDDGDVGYTVLLAAAVGGDYAGVDPADVAASNTDNDTVGVTVVPSATPLVTTEVGGAATFTVVLNSQPTATVTIGVSSNDTTEGTVSTSLLTFTNLDWAAAQTVTVTGVNDSLDDGDVGYTVLLAAAVGGDYAGVDPADVAASNTDNDTVGVTVVPSATPLVTTEVGGAATFTVVLNSQPTATVTIGVSSNDTTEGTVSTSLLTFTNLDWAAAQTVTVTGVNDSLDDGDVGYTVLLAAAVGGDYAGVDPADVAASNTDNDTSGGGGGSVVVVPPAGLVDTSAACPDSIATSSFGDLAGLDETTIQAIDCVFQYGVSNGTTDATFSPGGTVTRWQMALFLIRQVQVHGVALPTAIDQGFNDIGGFDPETKDAINQLAQLGITQGTGGGTFSASNPMSRWEMAMFLVRFVSVVGVPLPSPPASAGFTDLSAMNTDTTIAIDQLVELGIAVGTSTTTFEPSNSVLRWQMALFLTRVLAVDGIIPS